MSVLASARKLMTGTGTVTIVAAGTASEGGLATFSASQNFKPGALIRGNVNTAYFWTIVSGSDKKWRVHQVGGLASQAFSTNDNTSSRAKQGASGWNGAPPAVPLFMYFSPWDASGNPDLYTYVDSLAPENGVHPYTKDKFTGATILTSYPADAVNNAAPLLQPGAGVRIRNLEQRVTALDLGGDPTALGDPWRR